MCRQNLTAITKFVDRTMTECDGATRLLHLALFVARVPHRCMCGYILDPVTGDALSPLHFWIEVAGETIDYRARMWLGATAPHGVFVQQDYPTYCYDGQPVEFDLLGCRIMARLEGVNL